MLEELLQVKGEEEAWFELGQLSDLLFQHFVTKYSTGRHQLDNCCRKKLTFYTNIKNKANPLKKCIIHHHWLPPSAFLIKANTVCSWTVVTFSWSLFSVSSRKIFYFIFVCLFFDPLFLNFFFMLSNSNLFSIPGNFLQRSNI